MGDEGVGFEVVVKVLGKARFVGSGGQWQWWWSTGAGVPPPYGKQQEEGAIICSGGLVRLFIEVAGRRGVSSSQ